MSSAGVRVDALTKVFPSRRRGDLTAVDGVSFAVGRGEVVGLLGANGAGKTTTIKCLCGIIRPTAGAIEVDGFDVVADPVHAGGHVAAVLEGNRNLYWRMNVRENIEFFAGLQGIGLREVRSCRDDLVERFGLGAKARTPARMLSRGMQQKLALACALARQTSVLILDEPTLGLDVETSHELRAHLRELAAERTILLSSHDMDVVQDVCDRVVVLAAGRVVADDAVGNLLALFRAQAYRFVLDSPLTPAQSAAVHERFPLVVITDEPDSTVVEVEFADDTALYDLVDVLRAGGTRVVSIDRNEPDLEQVFLHLVRQRGAG
jgi:ABC-2 type transport system ATP-binding protein